MPENRVLLPLLLTPAVACALVATVSSGAVAPASASSPAQPQVTAQRGATDINVASFNIQSAGLDRTAGNQRPWRKRRATVARQILSNRIDVVGIQEAAYTSSFAPRMVYGRTQYLDLRNGLNAMGGRYAVTVKAAVNCRRAFILPRCRHRDRNASAAERILYKSKVE